MLYHVDDLEAAIKEAHRVLAPRGRYVAVVNLARSSPNLKEFVASLVIESGIVRPLDIAGRADSDNVPPTVESMFGTTTVDRYDNALVLTEPALLLRLIAAVLAFFGVSTDQQRARVMSRAAIVVPDWFAHHGAWRDPKGYVVVSAIRT